MHYEMQVKVVVVDKKKTKKRTEIFIISSKEYGLQTGKARTLACNPKSKWNIAEGYTCGSK